MAEKLFTVPDIYPDFKCKISDCRQSCCHGWEITLSMKEYFELVGMDCDPELRKRLDGSVYIVNHPSPERYAAIAKRYDGDCPMHDSNGYCSLQCCCGEAALTNVCRFYPRSPRTRHALECSVAASCEGVCELLFAKKEPLSFIKIPLDFGDVFTPSPDDDTVTKSYVPVRKGLVSIMQKRCMPLGARLSLAVSACEGIDAALQSGRDGGLPSQGGAADPYKTTDTAALKSAVKLLSGFDFRHSVYPFALKASENLAFSSDDFPKNYEAAKVKFAETFPDWERMFENVLVNHFFYEGLPFSDDGCSPCDNMKAMCAVYGLWRLVAVGYTLTSPDIDSLIDCTAAFFRLAENSPLPDNLAKSIHSKSELSEFDFTTI